MRALLIEPNQVFLSILTNQLEQMGFNVTFARNAEHALEQIEKELFQLICASAYLQEMNATDFAKKVRSEQVGHQHIPLIMFTADDNKTDLEKLLESGVTEVFQNNRLPDFSAYLRSIVLKFEQQSKITGRVLLVEDEESISLYISLILEHMGLEIISCSKAEDALALLKNSDFDLIITDFMLEGLMSGLGLVHTVRNLFDNKSRIPILAISSMNDASRRVELLRAGANDYIAKPVLPEELKARASNLISNKQLFDQSETQKLKLEQLAMIDQLTGLYNRHSLVEMSAKYISESIRHGHPLCLVVIDVDHFKAINDKHGHSTGDQVLKAVSALLQSQCRGEDFVARFGGEEFVIILSHCKLASAASKMEIIRQKIENLNPGDIKVTASFGISELQKQQHKPGFDSLFNKADEAVYIAKKNGRNRVECN